MEMENGILMKGMNFNGTRLKGTGRIDHILTGTHRHRIVVLFAQEHNFEEDDERRRVRTAVRATKAI